MIVEMPPVGTFEAEHRALYQPETEAHVGVIVQGSVHVAGVLEGNEDDSFEAIYDVRMMVGPLWRHVASVVPKVTIDGFRSTNPDQDDIMDWRVRNLTWDTVGELGPSNDELQIRLKFQVFVQGEHAQIVQLGYFLLASGRLLGEGGLNVPGPVKPQG